MVKKTVDEELGHKAGKKEDGGESQVVGRRGSLQSQFFCGLWGW